MLRIKSRLSAIKSNPLVLSTGVENTRLKKSSRAAECWNLYTRIAALKNHLVLSVGAKFTVGNLKSPLMLSVTVQYIRVCDQKQSSRAWCWHPRHEIKKIMSCSVLGPVHEGRCSKEIILCSALVPNTRSVTEKPSRAQWLTPSTWSGYQTTREVLSRIKDLCSNTLAALCHCEVMENRIGRGDLTDLERDGHAKFFGIFTVTFASRSFFEKFYPPSRHA